MIPEKAYPIHDFILCSSIKPKQRIKKQMKIPATQE
jgi:hypothetical protein